MANVKITELTAATALAGTDVLPIVDVGADATKKVSVSDLLRNLPDGTASAPALAFADDQNTGVLSPGNNSLAFATSGTQRLVIDSSGRLLVGGTSAAATDSDSKLQVVSTGNPKFVLARNDTSISSGQSVGNILWYGNDSNGTYQQCASINAVADLDHGTGDKPTRLTFATTADGASSPTERLRIDSSGRLLLGTTTEGSSNADDFTVANSGNGGITIRTGTSSSGQIAFSDGTSGNDELRGQILYNHSSNYMRFQTDATERLRIDSSGRLLVGTSSAANTSTATKIQAIDSGGTGLVLGRDDSTVTADNTLGYILFMGNAGGSYDNCARIRARAEGTHASGDKPTYLEFSTTADGASSPTERMRIDSSGRVGIGTSSPDGELDVTGTGDANGGVLVVNDAGAIGVEVVSSQPTILLNENDTTDENYQVRLNSGDLLIQTQTDARTGADTKVTIDSSGRVGIGTTGPDANLHIKGGYPTVHIERDSATNYSRLLLDNTANDGGAIDGIGDGVGGLRFSTSDAGTVTERMRIDSSGRLLVGETHAIADFSTNLLNISHASGAGIQIGRKDTSVAADNLIGSIQFRTDTGSGANYQSSASIEVYAEDTHAAGDSPGRLTFLTSADGSSSPTERIRITQAGLSRFYGDNEAIYAATEQSSSDSLAVFIVRHSATSTTTGTDSLYILPNGNVQNTNNSYGAISDAKLKENIVDASSQWDDLKAIQVRNYNFIEGQTHTQIGVVAQEVETVSPGLVSESPDRDEEGNDLGTVTKSVNYSVLYMKAVKALQEAMDRIETLEAKVAALEAQ